MCVWLLIYGLNKVYVLRSLSLSDEGKQMTVLTLNSYFYVYLVMKRMRKRIKRKLNGIILCHQGKLLDVKDATLGEMGVAAGDILQCAMRICGGVKKKR